MFRILLIVAAIVLVVLLLRSLRTPRSSNQVKREERPAVPHMVRCAHCGLHVPEDEAWEDGEYRYCSGEHRNRGPAEED